MRPLMENRAANLARSGLDITSYSLAAPKSRKIVANGIDRDPGNGSFANCAPYRAPAIVPWADYGVE